MLSNLAEIKRRPWRATNLFCNNSNISLAAYSRLILGLLFRGYADRRFAQIEQRRKAVQTSAQRPSTLVQECEPAEGRLCLPPRCCSLLHCFTKDIVSRHNVIVGPLVFDA